MLGFVPTKKDGVVVLICRKCMLLSAMKEMFELEKWTSLVEDKAFLPWLLKVSVDPLLYTMVQIPEKLTGCGIFSPFTLRCRYPPTKSSCVRGK